MKQKLQLSLTIFVIGLLTVSMASSQGPRDDHDGRHSGMPNHYRNTSGFADGMGDMEITGTIDIEDSILIELHVSPSEEALQAMQERRNNMPTNMGNHQNMMPSDLMNTISVEIHQIVEFVDVDDNGFTSNDTIISSFGLNSTNLDEPVLTESSNGSLYTITSTDGNFVMFLNLNEDGGVPHAWKWSVEMNYPFQSNTTEIGITQSVTSNGGRHIHQTKMGGHVMPHQVPRQDMNRAEIRDDHPEVPMFFKWDETAQVDGQTENVTISRINNNIAISIPQGEEIYYDPEVGVELKNLVSANSLLDELLADFSDTISTPNIIALVITGSLILVVTLLRRSRD